MDPEIMYKLRCIPTITNQGKTKKAYRCQLYKTSNTTKGKVNYVLTYTYAFLYFYNACDIQIMLLFVIRIFLNFHLANNFFYI